MEHASYTSIRLELGFPGTTVAAPDAALPAESLFPHVVGRVRFDTGSFQSFSNNPCQGMLIGHHDSHLQLVHHLFAVSNRLVCKRKGNLNKLAMYYGASDAHDSRLPNLV